MNKLILIITLLFFCGCTLGPTYKKPKVCTPNTWKTPVKNCPNSTYVEHFWMVFNDETLNSLEVQAIAQNKDLYSALQRIREARAIVGYVRANKFPQLNLTPNYSNMDQLVLFPLPIGVDIFRFHQVQYNLPVNLSYEVDLWGKIEGEYKAAKFNAEAEALAYCTSLLTLTTDLAKSYFNLRSIDTQIDILKRTIEINKKDLDLIQLRNQKGITNYLDVTLAAATLADNEANLMDAIRQRSVAENQIATLMGIPASLFCIKPRPLLAQPPCVPAGLPSEILCKRPDIREAERKMASMHALIGVAYANFYPSLQLTGSLGFSSPLLGEFLTWPSRLWAYGFNMNQVIFDGGKNCAILDAAYARFNEVKGNYVQTVLVAFQEVEDSLNNLEMQAKQFAYIQESLRANQKRVELTEKRYSKGLIDYLDVITAKNAELAAETSLNQINNLRYLSTIQLIKALGGGWLKYTALPESCSKK